MVAAEELRLEAVRVNVAGAAAGVAGPPRTCRLRGDPMGVRD